MEAKAWYQSKTIIGLILTVVALVAAKWQLAVPTDDATIQAIIDLANQVAEIVGDVGAIIGPLLALWGRMKGSPVTLTKARAEDLNAVQP